MIHTYSPTPLQWALHSPSYGRYEYGIHRLEVLCAVVGERSVATIRDMTLQMALLAIKIFGDLFTMMIYGRRLRVG